MRVRCVHRWWLLLGVQRVRDGSVAGEYCYGFVDGGLGDVEVAAAGAECGDDVGGVGGGCAEDDDGVRWGSSTVLSRALADSG